MDVYVLSFRQRHAPYRSRVQRCVKFNFPASRSDRRSQNGLLSLGRQAFFGTTMVVVSGEASNVPVLFCQQGGAVHEQSLVYVAFRE